MLINAQNVRSNAPARSSERCSPPPMSDERTSEMCAVRVLIESRGDIAKRIALPASIVGMSASPTARPNPKIAAESIDFEAIGRTIRLRCCNDVIPRAEAVIFVSSAIERTAPSIMNVMVGTPCNARIMLAVSQQNPVPPKASLIIGTKRNTAANPYTTVGIAVMRVKIVMRNFAMNFGARPFIMQQHPSERHQLKHNDDRAKRTEH